MNRSFLLIAATCWAPLVAFAQINPNADDVRRIARLRGQAQQQSLRDLLQKDVDWRQIVYYDERFRSSLRLLVRDPKVGFQAEWLLALDALPEDLSWLVQRAPRGNQVTDNRWAYHVAASLVQPSSEMEWQFLRRCARGDFDDGWVDFGAIQTL